MASKKKSIRGVAATPIDPTVNQNDWNNVWAGNLSNSRVDVLVDGLAATWSALEKLQAVEIPEGAFNIKEYARRFNIPYRTAHGRLQRMVDAGDLTATAVNRTWYFQIVHGRGCRQ